MKTALITGVNGQDGSYLSEYLLGKGYKVVGLVRRSSTDSAKERLELNVLDHENFTLVEGDLCDAASVSGVIAEHKPDECYNTAAQSHVATSFKQPSYTFQVNAVGVLNLLEAIRVHSPSTKFMQCSTSEMFGDSFDVEHTDIDLEHKYQDEKTRFAPRSPYAVAKMAAHNLVHTYRESYGLFACCAITYNHESPRRGETFVTRKITKWLNEFQEYWGSGMIFENVGICRMVELLEAQDNENYIYRSLANGFPKLRLGNLDAKRDWGFAGDMVKGFHSMLQQKRADDFVFCTGETHSVREFLNEAFSLIGIKDWSSLVVVDPAFYRPAEVEYLCGKYDKAKKVLGWEPTVKFKELVKMMVEADGCHLVLNPNIGKRVYTNGPVAIKGGCGPYCRDESHSAN